MGVPSQFGHFARYLRAQLIMLRVILLLSLIAGFAYAYRSVLFSRTSVLEKLKRVPLQTAAFGLLALLAVNGFRGAPEVTQPSLAKTKHGPDVETTAAITQLPPPDPLRPDDAAVACVEQARSDARATKDIVAEVWLSSVEGFLQTAPGEVTVQFAVGPKAGPTKGPQCRSEARLTCAVNGRVVQLITPVHMTGARIAC